MYPTTLELEFFRSRGFIRKMCSSCGSAFWTLDPERTACGDTPCVEYDFIGAPVIPEPYDLDSMREHFISFFSQHGHRKVERYPVVARWRDDVLLVNASIYDFQPHATSGQVPPPANPLVVSQPCIRMTDLDSVGRSGRHTSNFEMMAHHAFNSPKERIYWKEETVNYCHNLMTASLGMKPEVLTYKENPWTGGGNGGLALEVLAGGLEVATLVFMDLASDPSGEVVLKGERFSPMKMQIVDTGYGLERLVWASRGTTTVYEAIYPDVVAKVLDMANLGLPEPGSKEATILAEGARLAGIMAVDTSSRLSDFRKAMSDRLLRKGVDISAGDLARVMEPFELAHALADHARCLALLMGDGVVPSESKVGYLARLVLRKALRLMEQLGVKSPIEDIVLLHERNMAPFLDLSPIRDSLVKMLRLETGRYAGTVEKGERLVRDYLRGVAQGGPLGTDALVELYDTHGIHPTIVERIAGGMGHPVDVPDNFHALVAGRHSAGTAAAAAAPESVPDLPPTRPLYYENPLASEFDAVVLRVEGTAVMLDQTAFYPEGGGQPCDLGILSTPHRTYRVTGVTAAGGVVLHHLDEPGGLKAGDVVKGRIDGERRLAHTRHHTATHIMIASSRKVLGPHVWQAGAQKGAESARLDITHYDNITPSQLQEIELLANETVMRNLPVEKLWMDRDDAERKYGFTLYQGGPPAGNSLRVVRILDMDAEACGGTHCAATSEVGPIKILRCDRIQDGVERLVYSAGPAAIREVQRLERLLREASGVLRVTPEQLPKTAARFFEEWKDLRKEVEGLRVEASATAVEKMLHGAVVVAGVSVVSGVREGADAKSLANLSAELLKGAAKRVVVIGGTSGTASIVVSRTPDVAGVHCGNIARNAAEALGGSGGGRETFGQGGGPKAEGVERAVRKAVEAVMEAVGSLKPE